MTPTYLPGTYPFIVQIKPKLGGVNNLGVGVDTDGKEYVLKRGERVCVAEFVGAALCAELGVPHAKPNIVCWPLIGGGMEHGFGSLIEPDLHTFDRSSLSEWQAVASNLCDATVFSTTLALDLALGNDDRHSTNWLVKAADPSCAACHQMMAMDFSNAWPLFMPPHHPRQHPSANTWNFTRHWDAIGIAFDHANFRDACAKISLLDSVWLRGVLEPMVHVCVPPAVQATLCQWWQQAWHQHLIDVIYALEPDGDWQ